MKRKIGAFPTLETGQYHHYIRPYNHGAALELTPSDGRTAMKGLAFWVGTEAIYPLLLSIGVKYRLDVLETKANLH